MQLVKYLALFFWLEAIVLLSFGCSAPKERRGDWMEHLNYRQFTYNPPSIHWDRHNYYTEEELKIMWEEAYQEAIEDLPAAAKRIQNKNTDEIPSQLPNDY